MKELIKNIEDLIENNYTPIKHQAVLQELQDMDVKHSSKIYHMYIFGTAQHNLQHPKVKEMYDKIKAEVYDMYGLK